MIKIEFPAGDKRAAECFGAALLAYADVELEGVISCNDQAAPAETKSEQAAPAEPDPKPEPEPEQAAPAEPDPKPEPEPEQADVKTDMKGVPFNDAYCGVATDPFYGSGPRKGQWKKKRGVSEDDYDAWYSDALLGAKVQTEVADETQVDTGAAFGGYAAAAEQTKPPVQEPEVNAPTNAGEFFTWMSELAASGRVQQSDIDAAWKSTGLTQLDLFPPTAPDQIAANVRAIYDALRAKAGA